MSVVKRETRKLRRRERRFRRQVMRTLNAVNKSLELGGDRDLFLYPKEWVALRDARAHLIGVWSRLTIEMDERRWRQ